MAGAKPAVGTAGARMVVPLVVPLVVPWAREDAICFLVCARSISLQCVMVCAPARSAFWQCSSAKKRLACNCDVVRDSEQCIAETVGSRNGV